jgi:hypothetical protein
VEKTQEGNMSYSYVGATPESQMTKINSIVLSDARVLDAMQAAGVFINRNVIVKPTDTDWTVFKQKVGIPSGVSDSLIKGFVVAQLPEYASLKLPKTWAAYLKELGVSASISKPKAVVVSAADETVIAPTGYTGGTGIDWMKYIKYGGIAGGGALILYFLYRKFSNKGK